MGVWLAALLIGTQDRPIRLECVADNGICIHPDERALNHGRKSILRIKGIEHVLLLDFDVAPLRGRAVGEARLYLRPAHEHKLKLLGISTVAALWKEGESCFLQAARGERDWAWPGSDFLGVSFGSGGSAWFAREIREEKDGWISVDVPPAVLHAIVEGNSHGLAVSDEKGQTRANNDVYSREQSGQAPYILVLKSKAGKAPSSGAKLHSPDKPKKVEAREVVPSYKKPQAPKSEAFRILYEGEQNPKAASAGRLWDGKSVTLVAARGEHVAFQIALDRPGPVTGDGWDVHAILSVGKAFDPLVAAKEGTFFHVERYIPKDASPGVRSLSLSVAGERVPVQIRVVDVAIPDALAFHISLNTYGTPQPEREFHRLAHEHRATLAPLTYSHQGNVEDGTAPALRDGKISSWEEWDARYAPLFDGSAFRGLPRDGAPIDHFYLTFHESWPSKIRQFYLYRGTLEDHWRDAPPIEEAFPEGYAARFRAALAETTRHFVGKGWTRTSFHVYLNNKNMYWKPDRDCSWWTLDEPMFRDDFLALRYFARLFRESAKPPLRFRIDLSRPQWRREYLDGLVDLDVIGGVYREYPRAVFGRGEDVWTYGTTPVPSAGGQAPRAWILQAFLDGCDGIVPWQTVGGEEAWSQEVDTAILLPKDGRVFPTLRLKMLRRGELDVELLRLLLEKKKWSRAEVRTKLAGFLNLVGEFRQSSAEDAGRIDFGSLDADRFEAFRRAVLDLLD